MKQYEIADNICKITKQRPQSKREDLNNFKYRLVVAADELDDAGWEELDETTKDWVSACVSVVTEAEEEHQKQGKTGNLDLPPLPKFPEETQEERENDPDVVDTDKGNRARQRRTPAMSKAPKKGVQWEMKKVIAKNPNISEAALRKSMDNLGYKVTKQTCYGILANFRQSMKVLKELNMLTDYNGDSD